MPWVVPLLSICLWKKKNRKPTIIIMIINLESIKQVKDTLLFMVAVEGMLYLGHDGALHGFNLATQFSQLPLLATEEH